MDRRQEFCIERNQSLRRRNPAASFVVIFASRTSGADHLNRFPLPARSGERIKVRGISQYTNTQIHRYQLTSVTEQPLQTSRRRKPPGPSRAERNGCFAAKAQNR